MSPRTLYLCALCSLTGWVGGRFTHQEAIVLESYWMSGAQYACIRIQNLAAQGVDPTINQILNEARGFFHTDDYLERDRMVRNGWFPPVKSKPL